MNPSGNMSSLLIKEMEINVFAHATEEVEQVKLAVKKLLSEKNIIIKSNIKRFNGHFNDPIILIKSEIKQRKMASKIFFSILDSLSNLQQEIFFDEIDDHIDDKGNIYLRFDKQRVLKGDFLLSDTDPIRIKAKFNIPHKVNPAVFIKSKIESFLEKKPSKHYP